MEVEFLRSGKWDVGLGGPYVEGVKGEETTLPDKHAMKLYGWDAVKLLKETDKTDEKPSNQSDEKTDDGDGSDDPFGLNEMDKEQLEEFAKKEFEVDLDKRKSEKKLREQVFGLIESK